MQDIESICFEVISSVGSARSLYIEAIQAAKNGDFEMAKSQIEAGNEMFTQGHHAHTNLIQQEANGEDVELSLLLVHAEDQLMSAEAFKILSMEFIDVYKMINR